MGLAAAVALAAVLGLRAAGLAHAAVPFVVDSTGDAVDARVGDGICATARATCTLRAAIQETNALAGPDTIRLPPGVYALAIPPLNDNGADTGDLDVDDSLSVLGAGAAATILDAGEPPAGAQVDRRGLDRLFEVHASAGDVSISGLTIREGYTSESGGAILHGSPRTLRLEDVAVLDSYAGEYGGAVDNAGGGRVELVGSTLSGNAAVQGGSAINNAADGSLSVLRSTVSGNPGTYPLGAGAIHNQAEKDAVGTITIVDSSVIGNAAVRAGAAVHSARDGSIVVERSRIGGNTTTGDGGAIYAISGTVAVSRSTITGNEGQSGGGIFVGGLPTKAGPPARIEITSSAVSGNSALQSGGGIYNGHEAELHLTDVTISGNRAVAEGGGLSNQGKAALAFSRGTIADNLAGDHGGGVATESEAAATFNDVVFMGNSAGDAGGGGLYTDLRGEVSVTASRFERNTAVGDGGGVALHSSGAITVADTTIRANESSGDGGGVENSAMIVSFERTTVSGNRAVLDGGGIHNTSSGEFVIRESVVADNSAENGGGISNLADSTLLVSDSTLRGNSALANGGGLANAPDSSVRIDRSTFESNTAAGLGGAYFDLADGAGEIENSTLSGNSAATAGGAVYHAADGVLRLVNVTIWHNSAPEGGAISTLESDAVPTFPPTRNPAVVLRNTIVGGSLEGGGCDALLTTEGGNLDTGDSCGLTDPHDRGAGDTGLQALAQNGGLTRTHALAATSPAVDGGIGPCPGTDQRGVARPQLGGCDIGAYELEHAATVTAPAAPTDVSAVAADGQATVVWSAPASDGGSPITGYLVTPFVGDVAQATRVVANVTHTLVTGLANGTTYRFRVRATNAVGAGPESAASNAVTPQPPPAIESGDGGDGGDGGGGDGAVAVPPASTDAWQLRWQRLVHRLRRAVQQLIRAQR